jgi:1-acyl-sn-glycerol-3-phosphate acyltransferase
MLQFLPHWIRGLIAAVLLAMNTGVCGVVLLLFSLVKLVIPVEAVRRRIDPILNWIAEQWAENNSVWSSLTQRVQFVVEGVGELRRRGWYLVEANHQSWADIFVLHRVFNRRIPMLKFFLKRELIWVPVIGLAWWALDFPFMRRYSEKELREHPERRARDMETIRRSCAKFSIVPTSVMNFLEGTRFTPEKHAEQGSPFRHLLKPKSGGIALAMSAMGEAFH